MLSYLESLIEASAQLLSWVRSAGQLSTRVFAALSYIIRKFACINLQMDEKTAKYSGIALLRICEGTAAEPESQLGDSGGVRKSRTDLIASACTNVSQEPRDKLSPRLKQG